MKLAIFGATGKTGHVLLQQALDAGHEVVALVRDATKLTLTHPSLTILSGSIYRAEDVERTLRGADAVLSALGARSLGKMDIYSKPMEVIAESMRKERVKRLIVITSGGVEDKDPRFGFFYKTFLKGMLLKNVYADMIRAEAFLTAQNDIDWIIVRPCTLTDGPQTGDYRVSKRLLPPGKRAPKISRRDVAHFMLEQLTRTEYVHGTPTMASA
jgi:putative NADH-flavin reductase